MSHNRQPQLFNRDSDQVLASVDDLFEAWWRQYPRRVAKGAARKAFKRVLAKKIATFDQLMTGAMRYGAEKAGEDPTFTKHPASWLNAECWLDEPKPIHRKPMTAADSMIVGMMSGMTEEDARALAGALDATLAPRRGTG